MTRWSEGPPGARKRNFEKSARKCPDEVRWFVEKMTLHYSPPIKLTNMKTKVLTYCATLLLATTAWLNAGEPGAPKPASPEFERMKTLVGTWTGKTDVGQGPIEMTVHYRLLAAGSVLEERVFEGTPNEMVTMYYDKEGKLSLTHYCMLGNRPAMALKASDGKSMTFDFDGSCCTIDPKKESHMHGLTLRFDDGDTITTSCQALIDGKEMAKNPTTLKRVKSETAAK
jgi:hypothetical protein